MVKLAGPIYVRSTLPYWGPIYPGNLSGSSGNLSGDPGNIKLDTRKDSGPDRVNTLQALFSSPADYNPYMVIGISAGIYL